MKFLTSTAIVVAALSEFASAHYRFNYLTANGVKSASEYQFIRKYTSYNSPVTDTRSNDIRCNVGGQSTGSSTDVVNVPAGSTVTFALDQAVYHQGPLMWYLGKAPGDVKSWDGSGANWFKIAQVGPTFNGNTPNWPLSNSYSTRIPSSTPAGQYLLRIEQIGLHNPGAAPQFYISCAQINVTGGGSGNPSKFSIPGHISGSEPGMTVNIYNPSFTSYQFPGPAPWTG